MQEYLADLYIDGSHLYTIKDGGGNVITEKFLQDTMEYFKDIKVKNWYDTMGEFYYDNATFLITRVLKPTITVTEIELKTAALDTMYQDGITWYINGVNPSVSVSANRGTASFTTNFYMQCSLDGIVTNYGVISNTYTASARP